MPPAAPGLQLSTFRVKDLMLTGIKKLEARLKFLR
jgi:hypothetical protein